MNEKAAYQKQDLQTPIVDPLLQYSKEDLVSLVTRQAEENQILRDESAHFEQLYLDIIHSTSWKLSWPIRAAFKILILVKDQFKRLLSRKINNRKSTRESIEDARPTSSFDEALSHLLLFRSPLELPRLNLLISQRLTPAGFESLLAPLANLAAAMHVSLRVISLDPNLSARDCQAIFMKGEQGSDIDFVFHSIELSRSARSPFRLEFGNLEIALSQTQQADNVLSSVIPSYRRLIVDHRLTDLHDRAASLLSLLLDKGEVFDETTEG